MFKFFKSKLKGISTKFINLQFSIGSKIKALFSKDINESSLIELEKLLYEADLGVDTAVELVDKIKEEIKKIKDISSDEIINIIKKDLLNILKSTQEKDKTVYSPLVIMLVGVNGSGKTTSIAKLANLYKQEGKKVLIAAADTFRSAAVEQLTTWAEKLGVDIIKSKIGADAAAVAFDALLAAKARNVDVVLIDTAGRLQTKTSLMHELEKIKRICQKQIEKAPHKTYLTLDATTGQNAIDQAEIFNKFTPIDGIILSKLDGSAKGGIVVAIKKQLNIDVIWAGTGENLSDLNAFDPDVFVEELLATE